MSSGEGTAPPSPLSGAAFTDEVAAAGPAAVGPRYERGGLLGRGGMGEVHIARDVELGRDVALKTAHPGDPGAAHRLAREAALTARLEHPNIVPVYAAGRDAEGRPWYAMRRLPGRSLAAVLAATPLGPPRLRLVRHLTDAAQALAHAHERGVLHRDVKPANLMVGPQGETVLADWGLACTREEAADAVHAGTPGYMAPEQGRRGPVDERVDIYGLGAALFELLSGAPPPAKGPIPRLQGAAIPPELAAIAHRALQPDPADRYPTARAFADDLLAWFEGRRVTAHQYSAGEHLGRLIHRFRLPLAVAAVALVALTLAVSWGLRQSLAEQARARASEARALQAQAEAQSSLGAALAAQAVTAARAGRPMESEILAANALLHGESALARGILARFSLQPRFILLDRSPPIPPCARSTLSSRGQTLLCIYPDEAQLLDPFHPAGPLHRFAGVFSDGGFDGDDHAVLVDQAQALWHWAPPAAPQRIELSKKVPIRVGRSAHAGRTALFGAGTDILIDIHAGTVLATADCGTSQKGLTTLVTAAGDLLTGCSNHEVRLTRPGEATRVLGQTSEAEGPPTALAEGPDGRIWLGTLGGTIRPLDGPEPPLQVGRQFPLHLAIGATTGALATEEGLFVVWDLATGREQSRLHDRPGPVVWLEPDTILRLFTDHAEDRRAPPAATTALLRFREGVGALTLSPDGADLAVGLGDGLVQVFNRATGSLRWSATPQDGVVKDLAYSVDGRTLAAATVTFGVQPLFEAATGQIRGHLPGDKIRRLAQLPRGGWLVGSYRPLFFSLDAAGQQQLLLREQSALDIDHSPSGAVVGTFDNEVYRITDGTPPTLTRIASVYDLRSVAALGSDVLVGGQDDIRLYDARGALLRTWSSTSAVNELASSPDGATFASGHHTGEVYLWRPDQDEPVASFIGHASRVNALAFSPDGRTLYSGSWDLTVRAWDISVIQAEARPLQTAIETAWGRDLNDVLSGVY